MFKFKQHNNSLVSLGVGKKVLITKWLDEMGVENYIINDDLTIDVKDGVDLHDKGLVKFPDYIKFDKISGWFDCNRNNLISLKGCPKIVDNYFTCGNNKLISLEGCPKYVHGYFSCVNNKKQFIKEEVREVCNVIGNIYV